MCYKWIVVYKLYMVNVLTVVVFMTALMVAGKLILVYYQDLTKPEYDLTVIIFSQILAALLRVLAK